VTIWLWVIGITAIIWPVIVASYFEREANNTIENNFKRYGQMHEYMEKQTADKITSLQEIIEKQDALITALWQKTFGFYREGPYDGSELPEYLGVKPEWHPFQREWAGPVVYLVRYGPYPWGKRAEHLNFPE
jgi:hypothetical protein